MYLEKERSKENHIEAFDFFKKNKIKKKRITTFKKFLTFFFNIQILFMINEVYNLDQKFEIMRKESEQLYNNYADYQKALKEGNQNEIIFKFGEFSNKNAIGDLLKSGTLLAVLSQDKFQKTNSKNVIENNYKVDPETKATLLEMYNKNWRKGLAQEHLQYKEISCFPLNISCYAISYIVNKVANDTLNSMEKKMQIEHYNINHIDEYVSWRNDENNMIRNMVKDKSISAYELEHHLSPGEKALGYE